MGIEIEIIDFNINRNIIIIRNIDFFITILIIEIDIIVL